MSVTNEDRVGLPPLSASRKATWDYYRIEFLADGYPGRRNDGVVQPHPIYGPYVISDYLTQFRQTRDHSFLTAATRVADAAIDRMETLEDGLVFRYKPHTGVSSLPLEFYSGLTQSRYLSTLGRLDAALHAPRFADAGEAILRSLTLPADQGGVARQTPAGGLMIEEYSHAVPDYTLNGWTTATTLIHEYAEATGSDHAYQVFRDSIHGIADVLPLYDVPELANSRYRLSGQARVRLTLQNVGARVLAAWVDMPGYGQFPVEHGGTRKWSNQWVSGLDEDGRLTRTTAGMDVVLCRLTWPRPHRIHLEVDVPETSRYALKIADGKYDPLSAVAPLDDWLVVDRGELAPGRNVLDIPIPWHQAELVAYPTNFGKSIEGTNYNWYHFIHVDTLRKLHGMMPAPMLDYYHHRWQSYPERWPSIPEYQADISYDRYKA